MWKEYIQRAIGDEYPRLSYSDVTCPNTTKKIANAFNISGQIKRCLFKILTIFNHTSIVIQSLGMISLHPSEFIHRDGAITVLSEF